MIKDSKDRITVSLNRSLITNLKNEADKKGLTVSQVIGLKLSDTPDPNDLLNLLLENKMKEMQSERIKKGIKAKK